MTDTCPCGSHRWDCDMHRPEVQFGPGLPETGSKAPNSALVFFVGEDWKSWIPASVARKTEWAGEFDARLTGPRIDAPTLQAFMDRALERCRLDAIKRAEKRGAFVALSDGLEPLRPDKWIACPADPPPSR